MIFKKVLIKGSVFMSELYANKIISNVNIRKNGYDGLALELITLDVFEYGEIGILYQNKYVKKINLNEVDSELTLFLVMCVEPETIFTNEYGKFIYKGFIDNQNWDLNVNDILCLSPVRGLFTADLKQTPLIPIGIVLENTKIYFDGVKKFSTSKSTSTPTPQYTDFIINPSNISPDSSYSGYTLPSNLQIGEPIFIGNISLSSTQYIIMNSNNEIVYDSGEIAGKITTFNIPLNNNIPYGNLKWKARYKDSNNRWTSYSNETNLTYVQPTISKPTPVLTPINTIIGKIDLITISAPIINGPITCQSYQIIINNSSNEIVYNSSEQPYNNIHSFIVNIVLPSGTYTIKYRYKSSINIWSEYSNPTTFIIREVNWLDYNASYDKTEYNLTTATLNSCSADKLLNNNVAVFATTSGYSTFDYNSSQVRSNNLVGLPSSNYVYSACSLVNMRNIDTTCCLYFFNNSTNFYCNAFKYNTTSLVNGTTNIVGSGITLPINNKQIFITLPYISSSYYFYTFLITDDSSIYVGLVCIPITNPIGYVLSTLQAQNYKLTINSTAQSLLSFCCSELTNRTIISVIYDSGTSQTKIIFITINLLSESTPSNIGFSDQYILFPSTRKCLNTNLIKIDNTTLLFLYKDQLQQNKDYACLIYNIDTINHTFLTSDPIELTFSNLYHPYSKIYAQILTNTDILVFDNSNQSLGVLKYNSINKTLIFYQRSNYLVFSPQGNISSSNGYNRFNIVKLTEYQILLIYNDYNMSDKVVYKFVNLY